MRVSAFTFTPLGLEFDLFKHTRGIPYHARAESPVFGLGRQPIWNPLACNWLQAPDDDAVSDFRHCRERSNCGENYIRLPSAPLAPPLIRLCLGRAGNLVVHVAKALSYNCREATAGNRSLLSRRPRLSSNSQVWEGPRKSSKPSPDAKKQSSRGKPVSSKSGCGIV